MTFEVKGALVLQFVSPLMRCRLGSEKLRKDGSFSGECHVRRPKQIWQVTGQFSQGKHAKGTIIHIPLSGRSRNKHIGFGWTATQTG